MQKQTIEEQITAELIEQLTSPTVEPTWKNLINRCLSNPKSVQDKSNAFAPLCRSSSVCDNKDIKKVNWQVVQNNLVEWSEKNKSSSLKDLKQMVHQIKQSNGEQLGDSLENVLEKKIKNIGP